MELRGSLISTSYDHLTFPSGIGDKTIERAYFYLPGEPRFPLQQLHQFNRVRRCSCGSGDRHPSAMLPSWLVLRATGNLPVAVHGGFTAAHQEDRDAFHQRSAGMKARGASIVGADADADADAVPAIHSSFRARREAAFPGHPSEIRERKLCTSIGQCLGRNRNEVISRSFSQIVETRPSQVQTISREFAGKSHLSQLSTN